MCGSKKDGGTQAKESPSPLHALEWQPAEGLAVQQVLWPACLLSKQQAGAQTHNAGARLVPGLLCCLTCAVQARAVQ